MSYAAILEKLEQTSIDMEHKRTQFHDAKAAIGEAETSLSEVKKEKIKHEKMLSYLDFEKAKEAFEEENYELAREIAIKSSEESNFTITETKKLKDERNKIEELLDDALIEKLQFDKKEKDNLSKSIKEIDQAIENGEVIVAKERIENERDSLEKNISRKRILKFAPPNWNKLEKLDKNAELYEYYTNDKWDLDGLADDLKILQQRRTEKEDVGTELVKIPDIWTELSKLDKSAKESDYRTGDHWDLTGIRDDLALLKGRNQKLKVFEAKKEEKKKKTFTKTSEKKKTFTKTSVKKEEVQNSFWEDNFAYPEAESKNTKLDDLKYLKELYDEGLIDDKEFEAMKKEVLGK